MNWLALVAAATTTTSTTTVQTWVDDAVAGRDVLPSLAEVQRLAVGALALGDEARARGWDAAARWRALLPNLQVRFGSERDVLVRDSIEGLDWARSGQGIGLDLGARWNLSELLLSDLEMRIHRERLARSAAVRLARERVTRVYFQRVEVLVQCKQASTSELVIEAARLDGLLSALTGGRYRTR